MRTDIRWRVQWLYSHNTPPPQRKGQAHLALQDLIRHVGTPAFIVVDGAPEENKGEG